MNYITNTERHEAYQIDVAAMKSATATPNTPTMIPMIALEDVCLPLPSGLPIPMTLLAVTE